jgi:hypothetical protein
MEVVYFSERSVNFYLTIWSRIHDDCNLHAEANSGKMFEIMRHKDLREIKSILAELEIVEFADLNYRKLYGNISNTRHINHRCQSFDKSLVLFILYILIMSSYLHWSLFHAQ